MTKLDSGRSGSLVDLTLTGNVCRWLIVALILTAASTARAGTMKQLSNWTGGVSNLPSDVLMYVYLPDKMAANPPVLTILHSCQGDAGGVLGQANDLKMAADTYGFIIVLPQSNPSSKRCWTTDSTQVWTRDKGGDSNAIKQMVLFAISTYQANPDRVYVTGCSSGAMMTELLLGLYPDIFKAGASFAGMPAGCHGPNDNASNATGYNGTCGGGPVNYTAQQWGDLVRAMDPGYMGHRPRLQLFHGSADNTISYSNMAESVSQYINLLGLGTNPTKTNTGLTLGTHQASEQQWNNACGYLVLDAFDSIGGDHGPSDALFVGKYVVPFLGLDKTGPTDPEIAQCGNNGAGGAGANPGMGGAGAGSGGAGGRGGAAGGLGSGGVRGSGGVTASGGMTASGGVTATGGATASGGVTATGGVHGSGGSTATGGVQGSGGTSTGGVTASGGASGSGGRTTGSGGTAPTGSGGTSGTGDTTGSTDAGGCSCAVGDAERDRNLGLALGLTFALFALRRRRTT